MTLQKAKSIARHLGLTLRQLRSGNYRVNFRDGNETTAYYTDDLEDAVSRSRYRRYSRFSRRHLLRIRGCFVVRGGGVAATNKTLAQSNKSRTGLERLRNRTANDGFSDEKMCPMSRKLGLGARSRNVWNGRWWVHVVYCSTHCEALHELERYHARVKM